MTLEGKTVLITGATDGLGRLVAEIAAREGATVLLHGRSQGKGEAVLAEIKAATGNDKLRFYRADFAALDEVRALGAAVARDHPRLGRPAQQRRRRPVPRRPGPRGQSRRA